MLSLTDRAKNAVRGTLLHRAYRTVVPSTFTPPIEYERKREIIVEHGRRFGLRTLVETGTCLGDTVRATLPHFDAIHTIELDEALYSENEAQFASEPTVTCYQGDSALRLRDILPLLETPTLFWLDAHFSGAFEKDGRLIQTARADQDTPIKEELDLILNHTPVPFVVLIDDAREFVGKNDYPTLNRLRTLVKNRVTSFEVREDIIRLYP